MATIKYLYWICKSSNNLLRLHEHSRSGAANPNPNSCVETNLFQLWADLLFLQRSPSPPGILLTIPASLSFSFPTPGLEIGVLAACLQPLGFQTWFNAAIISWAQHFAETSVSQRTNHSAVYAVLVRW
ncbi:hypothetical protein Ancab_006809 [Ancistrocladus abbreviatus]